MNRTNRGSLWRLWDFHAHTPASYQWGGLRLRSAKDNAERESIIRQTVQAMNDADPDVYVLMDYWTFDGFLSIRKYLQANPNALGAKQIFPGIELRVESSLKSERLNVHLLLDPALSDQELADVLGTLKIQLKDRERSLSDDCFIQYARELGEDKLGKHGKDAEKVRTDDAYALQTGWETAEVVASSVLSALKMVGSKGLLLQPWDTYGGLKGIDFVKHYAEVRRLMRAADIFECKDQACREAFHGEETANNKPFFRNFWSAIDGKARLCVRGTDAHEFGKYGQFPNGMRTWLKAEPTFSGLQQAIREPAFRSYIGDKPPKVAMVEANGSLFMDRLKVNRRAGTSGTEKWFDGVEIELNADLVAIIGNKGSGKSGLAEVLALAGNCKARKYFTFLNDKRFMSGNAQRAGQFEATLTWLNGDTNVTALNLAAKENEPERIKYISQIYFEELCNEHVTGKSSRFEREIRNVLFSHMDSAERLSFKTLDDYLKAKEAPAIDRITAARQMIQGLNKQITDLESQGSPAYLNDLTEKLARKELALKDLEAQKPVEVPQPQRSDDDTEQPSEDAVRLEAIGKELESIVMASNDNDAKRRGAILRRNALSKVEEGLTLFESQAKETNKKFVEALVEVGVAVESVLSVQTSVAKIHEMVAVEEATIAQLVTLNGEMQQKAGLLQTERTNLQETLDAPNKAFQLYLAALQQWQQTKAALLGSAEQADTIEYYKAALAALAKLPEERKALEDTRNSCTRAIFKELSAMALARRALFAPVDQIVEQFPNIKDDLKVAFQSTVFFNKPAFAEKFFSLVKQNTGGFRGEEEGTRRLQELLRQTDFSSEEAVLTLMQSICDVAVSAGETRMPMSQVMRANKVSSQLYDLLFGLEDLELQFSLTLADTTIEQMSPGQRGALLLIFYLLVDHDPTPLILDQPEENLDNQTVYSMLVPIIQKAKQRRQIVMVTHNANLAVCCDAEQIIHAEFDRTADYSLKYECGAIENASMNQAVIDVLEGTQPAFGNRRGKYATIG